MRKSLPFYLYALNLFANLYSSVEQMDKQMTLIEALQSEKYSPLVEQLEEIEVTLQFGHDRVLANIAANLKAELIEAGATWL